MRCRRRRGLAGDRESRLRVASPQNAGGVPGRALSCAAPTTTSSVRWTSRRPGLKKFKPYTEAAIIRALRATVVRTKLYQFSFFSTSTEAQAEETIGRGRSLGFPRRAAARPARLLATLHEMDALSDVLVPVRLTGAVFPRRDRFARAMDVSPRRAGARRSPTCSMPSALPRRFPFRVVEPEKQKSLTTRR